VVPIGDDLLLLHELFEGVTQRGERFIDLNRLFLRLTGDLGLLDTFAALQIAQQCLPLDFLLGELVQRFDLHRDD